MGHWGLGMGHWALGIGHGYSSCPLSPPAPPASPAPLQLKTQE